jgi:hypothetical protein
MKKSLPLFVLLFLAAASNAQSTRMVLFEEFTGENCVPCANSNPGINNTLADPANVNRVAAIKWEVPIPSAPSKNTSLYQTNKAEINWRHLGWNGGYSSTTINAPTANGYGYPSQWVSTDPVSSGVNSAPQGRLDGQYLWSFGAGSNHGANLSTGAINNAANVPSPFTINMVRAWNSDATAITLTITVTASMNYTATGALVFRTVMVEKLVEFSTPSGSNGEKSFHDVAIKSFPNIQNGTALASTWNVNDTHTFTLNCVIPTYARKKTEIGFVGFIQDDGTRKVEQAAKLDKSALPNDAAAISGVVQPACAGVVNADIVVKNTGLNPITTMTITPFVDNNPATITNWTGNLAPGASATITMNPFNSPSANGGHVFSYSISSIGANDLDSGNDVFSANFLVANNYQNMPVVETFDGTFPPAAWTSLDTDPTSTWVKSTDAGAYGLTSESMLMSFYTNTHSGEVEDMILPPVDLSGAATPVLDFVYAYARRHVNNPDKLEILVSKDCGTNWTKIFDREGLALASVLTDRTNPFVPTAAEWRQESIELTDFNNATVLVKFRTTNRNGNNLYIDDINLRQPGNAGIAEINGKAITASIYPNPSNGSAVINAMSQVSGEGSVTVVNVLGQPVYTRKVQLKAGSNNIQVELGTQSQGIYYVTLQSGKTSVTKKLTVTN